MKINGASRIIINAGLEAQLLSDLQEYNANDYIIKEVSSSITGRTLNQDSGFE